MFIGRRVQKQTLEKSATISICLSPNPRPASRETINTQPPAVNMQTNRPSEVNNVSFALSRRLIATGNQRHRDPGAYPQCTGTHDGDPADLPVAEGQQHPLHEAEPPDLLAAV